MNVKIVFSAYDQFLYKLTPTSIDKIGAPRNATDFRDFLFCVPTPTSSSKSTLTSNVASKSDAAKTNFIVGIERRLKSDDVDDTKLRIIFPRPESKRDHID